MKFQDLTGKQFGRLTVIQPIREKGKRLKWQCVCECGKTTYVESSALNRGSTRSCGCLNDEVRRRTGLRANRAKHGMRGTRIYRTWKAIKKRCYCKTNEDYLKWYGAKGITVCEEWRHNFKAFYDWAMKNGYNDNLSIDRIDSSGNYCPENCRWTTASQQARNTEQTHFITYKGETHCIAEWAEILHISANVLNERFYRGWSIERAFTQPVRRRYLG